MSGSQEFRFDDVVKNTTEAYPVELNLYRLAANEWRQNESVDANEYVRPRIPNGFAYMVQVAGDTGAVEPRWPKTIDATVTDGSVTWICKAPASNGISPITSPTAESSPAGLTISAVAVIENRKIVAEYSGGSLDSDYEAVFTFTLDGHTRVARQLVKVRKA